MVNTTSSMVVNKEKEPEIRRKIRAYSMLAKGVAPKMIDSNTYEISSQNNPNKKYTIKHTNTWQCSCPDYKKRKIKCKHIQVVELWLELRSKFIMNDMGWEKEILELQDEFIERELICPFCSSINVIKNGKRKTKIGYRQRYLCKACKKRFVIDPIRGRKATAKIICLCMDLYYKGLSYRKIADTMYQFYGIELHHETIRRWINKFMKYLTEYVKDFKPEISGKWQVDEQKIKSKEGWVWSWNAIDNKTRFLIANTVTFHRSDRSARKIFQKIKEVTDKKPAYISTDGLASYANAIKNEFSETKHMKNVGLMDKVNNNKIERFHGSWRERDKVMRGLENRETTEQMLENYRTYYNFIRKHQALNGKTPAEFAGIDLRLNENKWENLLVRSIEK